MDRQWTGATKWPGEDLRRIQRNTGRASQSRLPIIYGRSCPLELHLLLFPAFLLHRAMKHVSLANLRLPSGVWCAMRLPLEGRGEERHARDDHELCVRCRFDRQELCDREDERGKNGEHEGATAKRKKEKKKKMYDNEYYTGRSYRQCRQFDTSRLLTCFRPPFSAASFRSFPEPPFRHRAEAGRLVAFPSC